ncbi:phage protein, partial [Staphylococcus aureus]
RKRKKVAELRKKEPPYFNVQQKHQRWQYECYLLENDLFVKDKK